MMQPYQAANGQSGVTAFKIEPGAITLRFRNDGTYRYDATRPGPAHVAEMQRLARQGKGLNTYVNKYVRKDYAKKLS
jgi:hypothetical protein